MVPDAPHSWTTHPNNLSEYQQATYEEGLPFAGWKPGSNHRCVILVKATAWYQKADLVFAGCLALIRRHIRGALGIP
jgi:hypothetical protein